MEGYWNNKEVMEGQWNVYKKFEPKSNLTSRPIQTPEPICGRIDAQEHSLSDLDILHIDGKIRR
jgi:hypothetical protein